MRGHGGEGRGEMRRAHKRENSDRVRGGNERDSKKVDSEDLYLMGGCQRVDQKLQKVSVL